MLGKYTVTEKIGRGATCIVYEGYNTRTKERVAIKVIDSRNKRYLQLAVNEIRILQGLSHPNIIRLIETIETETQTLLVLEKCRASLSSIARAGSLPYKAILRIFRDILVGLQYLHSNGIIHRDIKLGNVMISDTNELKILDFGLSKNTFHSAPKTFCGTPEFISPEILGRQPYTKKTDIYSAGMLVYFLLFRSDYSEDRLQKAKYSEKYRDMILLLEKMLKKDPQERISASEALQDRLFTQFTPVITSVEGMKPFNIKTKLGELTYRKEILQMCSERTTFYIRSGMSGIYQKNIKTFNESYIPFSSVDTKTLKLVSFCYSVLLLIKRRTPVVIIVTDRGRFFKMLKDRVYVYITHSYYILWQDEDISVKSLSTQRTVNVPVDKQELHSLIYQSIDIYTKQGHLPKPIVLDKRTVPRGTLKQSAYSPIDLSVPESTTLFNLPISPGTVLNTPSAFTQTQDTKNTPMPLFISNGCIIRVAPYIYTLFLSYSEVYTLNTLLQTLTRYSRTHEPIIDQITSSTKTAVLKNILLFEPVLNGTLAPNL
ncbi:hypothetical protein NEOKW01_0248 [Nematocida sp. AWRm80]|nr:hypothetical protein NEOKW01_0248 [Nematocida sp. AWRm80]